ELLRRRQGDEDGRRGARRHDQGRQRRDRRCQVTAKLKWAALLALAVGEGGPLGCGAPAEADHPIPIGLLLSYSGPLAANSVNSERAVLMAVEAVNAAGGVTGRPLSVLPRDTR